MRTFLFILFAGCAVRCDDSNYYVIQRPEDPVQKTFSVYWNVPTIQCKSKKIPFTDLYEKFGILQNEGDSFRGEKVSILYDPGLFPALLKNETSGEFKYRNGGVPQEGDLMEHLEVFKTEMEQSIPDVNFKGVGIIDFESWRPVFRQNFGVLTPYKDVSYEIEKRNHWWWKKAWIQAEAKRRFEESARAFMQTTLATAKKMRPHAQWGYYGFPYCFNMASNNMKEHCADKVPAENDGTYWLWSESTALYPSVYSSEELSSSQLAELITGRVAEARRVAIKDTPVLPYFWFRYRNGGYFNKKDLATALSSLYKSNTSGFIIWGSSNDVNTPDKCHKLMDYVNEVLGPAVAKYTKHTPLSDEYDDTPITSKPTNTVSYDPEFVWIPPQNYTENIQQIVDEEMSEDRNRNNTELLKNSSVLIDLILHSIANYCADENCGKDNVTKVKLDEGLNGKESESRIMLVTENPFRLNKTEGVDAAASTTTNDYIENVTEDNFTEVPFEEEITEMSTDAYNDVTYSTNFQETAEANYSTNYTMLINLNEPNIINETEEKNKDLKSSGSNTNENEELFSISSVPTTTEDTDYMNNIKLNESLMNSNEMIILMSVNETDNTKVESFVNSTETNILNLNETNIMNSNETYSTTLAPTMTTQVIFSVM